MSAIVGDSPLYARLTAASRAFSSSALPDPFMDIASLAMPETINDGFRWSEFILQSNGLYKQALKRIAAYFITNFERVGDVDDEQYDKYIKWASQRAKLKTFFPLAGLDYLTYGESAVSVFMSFERYLACPSCHIEHPFKTVTRNKAAFNFRWENWQFKASCPACKHRGEWKHIDRQMTDAASVWLKRWTPHELEVVTDYFSGKRAFIWKIPNRYVRDLQSGHLMSLEHAPWEVIEAAKNKQDLMLDPTLVYYAANEPLAGLNTGGRGLSEVLSNFKLAWHNAMLNRQNFSIATDFVTPLRILSPAPKSGADTASQDPMIGTNLSNVRAQVAAMLQRRARNPMSWQFSPIPLEYRVHGGEANQMAPVELIKISRDDLLSASGIPVDLFLGQLTLQHAYPALRLFESTMHPLIDFYNGLLQHIFDRVAKLCRWEQVEVRWESATVADDVQQQLAKLNLMSNRMISATTALRPLGINYEEEQRRIAEEQKINAKIMAEAQEDMNQAAMMAEMMQGGSGGPQQGTGAPMPPGMAGGAGVATAASGAAQQTWMQYMPQPNQSITMEDIAARADMIATDLLGKPEAVKDSELIQLKRMNPTIHASVRAAIERKRRELRLQGGAQLQQQMYGGGGAPQ